MTAFATLWRSFFAQFFSSETVTSDMRLRQGVIWVMAFLVAPGLSIALRFGTHYQFALHFAPERADGLLLMMMILFVSYSAVAIGLIAVFVWDALSFERRDAMVLGVLPIAGSTVVMAKLAALAALLGAAHAVVNAPTALIFAFAVSGNIPGLAIVRQILAHMLVTGMAGLSIFAALMTARGVLGLLSARLAAAAAAPFQFAFVAAMLCVMVLAVGSARTLAVPADQVGWIPSFWYVGLFEALVGSPRPVYVSLSGRAVWTTVALAASALTVTLAAFPLQFQRALAPEANPAAAGGSARLLRGVAWLGGARRPLARAVSDFVLVTLARNRSAQTIAAINAAIAAPIIAVGLWRAGSIDAMAVPRLAVLWIPMAVVYWLAVGLRASFYVPSELPASWAFAVNAPADSSQYRTGVRASILAALLPAGLLFDRGTRSPRRLAYRGTARRAGPDAHGDPRRNRPDHRRTHPLHARLSSGPRAPSHQVVDLSRRIPCLRVSASARRVDGPAGTDPVVRPLRVDRRPGADRRGDLDPPFSRQHRRDSGRLRHG